MAEERDPLSGAFDPEELDPAALDPEELLVIVGPTASGKSTLALELAKRLEGEIIGADSVQIYERFDVGSGKPTAAERARVPHHLVDCVDPLEPMDAARYVALADAAIAEVRAKGRRPIVCGGTFLWVKALTRGLAPMPPADEEIRAGHEALVEKEGRPALHQRLGRVDPEAAERLAPNDFVRVSRALEIYELTGKPQSAWHAAHAFRSERHRTRLLGVARSRETLDERIRLRVQGWLKRGWIDEVRALFAEGFGEARAIESVGYRQIRDHLAGELPADELEDAIVRATRRFVRRQRTWLRDEPVCWLGTAD